MSPKKIILCPNPNRDQGMKTTRAAERILRDLGFHTVVCSPSGTGRRGPSPTMMCSPSPKSCGERT